MGLLKKAAELCILCDIQMVLKFRDLNGKVVQYSSSNLRDCFEQETTNYFFTEKSYPDFFNSLRLKETLEERKGSIRSCDRLKIEDTIEKKLKKEVEDISPYNDNFEIHTPPFNPLHNHIEPHLFDMAENINNEYALQASHRPYSLRSANSRRHTFSFDFNNAPFMFGQREERRNDKPTTPSGRDNHSRLSSIDISKYL